TAVPPAPQIVDESRDVEAIDSGRAVSEFLLNFGTKLRRHALVGVEVQHPPQPRLLERELLLLAISRPVSDEHALRELPHDVERAVRRVRVDDDDLVAPRDALEAGADVVLLVVANDDRRDFGLALIHLRRQPP